MRKHTRSLSPKGVAPRNTAACLRQSAREIARQEEMIRKMKQHGTEHLAKRAASREKRLDMLERVERPGTQGPDENQL